MSNVVVTSAASNALVAKLLVVVASQEAPPVPTQLPRLVMSRTWRALSWTEDEAVSVKACVAASARNRPVVNWPAPPAVAASLLL